MILLLPIRKNQPPKTSQDIKSLRRFTYSAGERKSWLLPILTSLLLLFQLTGCQDTGVVGSKLPGSELEVAADTFQINAISPVHLKATTGNQTYFSAGGFDDPLFGDLNVIALLEPMLASKDSSQSFGANTKMMLKLLIHHKGAYGDTAAVEHFNLVAIDQIWRGKQWNIHKKVQLVPGSTIGSFSVSNQDSVMIPLSQKFVQKYTSFYTRTDSSRYPDYLSHFHGLAVVPQNANKIVAFNPSKSRLIITGVKVHTDSTVQIDTLKNIGLRYWAYTLNRSDTLSNDPETIKVYNTLENIAKFNFSLPSVSSDQIDPNNISKAEIVIHRAQQQLKTSIDQAGSHAVRPPNDTLRLYFRSADGLLESLDPGQGNPQPLYVSGIYNKADSAYHFNITDKIRWLFISGQSQSFYIVPNFISGIIRSSLLFNSQAGKYASPKIIITHTDYK